MNLEQKIYNKLIGYRDDPIGFMVNVLSVKKEHIWPKMREVAESVRDNQFTVVPACHDVSKTYTAGRLAVWFKSCFQPSTVITTAPSDNLVRQQLWREVRAAHSSSTVPLGGRISSVSWDCKPSQETLDMLEPEQRGQWEKNFAIGFSTSPDTVSDHATKIQGFHNKWVLLILDEGCGIHPMIWRTALDALIVNENCKVLAIGNPTDPHGLFAKACKPDSGWNVINISTTDTPNYKQRKEIIPCVAGRNYYDRLLLQYGIDNNNFKIRVLGQFPDSVEGAYYKDAMLWLRSQKRIRKMSLDKSSPVYTVWDPGYTTAILFFQLQGLDVVFLRCYEDTVSIEDYVEVLNKFKEDYGYRYGGHYAPFDVDSNANKIIAGVTLLEKARQHNLNFIQLTPEYRILEGIERTRQFLHRCWIDSEDCEVLVEALDRYRERKVERLSTEEHPVFVEGSPADGWEKHLCDAMRYASKAVKKIGESSNSLTLDEIKQMQIEMGLV